MFSELFDSVFIKLSDISGSGGATGPQGTGVYYNVGNSSGVTNNDYTLVLTLLYS